MRDSQNEWIRCQNQSERDTLWKYYRQKQRIVNLKVQKEKRNFMRQRQDRMLLMKLTNSKKTFN